MMFVFYRLFPASVGEMTSFEQWHRRSCHTIDWDSKHDEDYCESIVIFETANNLV